MAQENKVHPDCVNATNGRTVVWLSTYATHWLVILREIVSDDVR